MDTSQAGIAMLRSLYDWTLSLASRKAAEWWLAIIAFAVTWACMGLIQLVASLSPGSKR